MYRQSIYDGRKDAGAVERFLVAGMYFFFKPCRRSYSCYWRLYQKRRQDNGGST